MTKQERKTIEKSILRRMKRARLGFVTKETEKRFPALANIEGKTVDRFIGDHAALRSAPAKVSFRVGPCHFTVCNDVVAMGSVLRNFRRQFPLRICKAKPFALFSGIPPKVEISYLIANCKIA